MCACDVGCVCRQCAGTPFDPRYEEDAGEPMGEAEFDELVAVSPLRPLGGVGMTITRKPKRTWLCKCGYRNEVRTSSRKCQGCGGMTKPKRRVPKHAEALRDTSYEAFADLSKLIHGGEWEACGCCRKPRGESRRHDRDHDHRTGKPRGLACWHCNRELLRHGTLESLRAAVAYLERVEAFNGRT